MSRWRTNDGSKFFALSCRRWFDCDGAAGAANAESFTTRIEPRPFYGSVVTLEEGVRVIRRLPPVRQVIINPNDTPLSLGFNDTRVYERSENYELQYHRQWGTAYNGVRHL